MRKIIDIGSGQMAGSILGMGMGTRRIGSEQDGRREDWGRQLESRPISGTSFKPAAWKLPDVYEGQSS